MASKRVIVRSIALATLGLAAVAEAGEIIDFDVDPDGMPIDASGEFSETTALRELYASMGVHFLGPGDLDGGAILNQGGNFGVDAFSGKNFLAFNRNSHLGDGGIPTDPETILFDIPMVTVSIWAAGGNGTGGSFLMEAFDETDTLVASDSVFTVGFSQMSVSWDKGMTKVVLTELGADDHFVYDDLQFQPIPTPGAIALLGLVGLIAGRRRRR